MPDDGSITTDGLLSTGSLLFMDDSDDASLLGMTSLLASDSTNDPASLMNFFKEDATPDEDTIVLLDSIAGNDGNVDADGTLEGMRTDDIANLITSIDGDATVEVESPAPSDPESYIELAKMEELVVDVMGKLESMDFNEYPEDLIMQAKSIAEDLNGMVDSTEEISEPASSL